MRVTKIHPFNFRSVENLELDLTAPGLHALIGSFGSGKSTFLTGMRFALFGDTGSAGSNTDLRRRGCPDGEDAGCEVTFTQGQDIYTARRWLRRSERKDGTIVEKAHASLHINGKPVDGITPSKLTGQIEEIIGMNAKAFTSAAMIPQGEVDTLMKSTPAAVQALIEEHTGLDKLTKARDLARKQAKEAETIAKTMPGDPEQTHILEDQARMAKEDMDAAAAIVDTAKERATANANRLEQAEHELETLRTAENAAQNYRQDLAAAKARITSAEEALSQETNEANASNIDLDRTAEQDQHDRDNLDRNLERVTRAGQALAAAQRTAATAEDNTRAAYEESARTNDRLAGLDAQEKAFTARMATLESECSHLEEELTARRREADVAEAAAARLAKAIQALSNEAGDTHECPTCYQDVREYDTLLEDLRESMQAEQQRHTAALTASTKARKALDTAHAEQREIETKHQASHKARIEADHINRNLDHARQAEQAAHQQVEQATVELKNIIIEHGGTPAKDLLEQARGLHGALNRQRDILLTSAATRKRITEARVKVDEVTKQHQQLMNRPVEAPTPEQLAEALEQVKDRRSQAAETSEALSAANADYSSARGSFVVLQSQAEEARADWEAKVEASNEATAARGHADVLAALRSDLLAEYTASICQSASELLASFGGEYVAFHLDETFIPQAEITDGTLVRTSILSGGEAALVGLSARIGITLHVTGGGLPEQLIGDEVTNYLDETGRRTVLSTLNSVFPSVLLVSHTQESEDYATEVHRVTRAELGTTQWVEHNDNPGQADNEDNQPLAA